MVQSPLRHLFMNGVQLPQGYRATTRKQFTFDLEVPRYSWYSFDRPPTDENLSQSWGNQVLLNALPLDWESSAYKYD